MAKAQRIFQITYLLLFFIMGIGIAGNIELGVETSTSHLISFAIVSFLTVGKFVYCIITEKI